MPRPCVICDAILSLIRVRLNEEFSKYIDITEAEDPVSWNCKVHEPVLQASNWSDDDNLIRRGRVSFFKNAGAPVVFVENQMLHLVRRDDIPHHYGMGRAVSDPAWFDMDVIKGFVDNCKQNHGELCEYPFGNAAATAQLPRPSYLIDVQARCVVAGSQVPVGKPFLFLSYVRQDSDAQKYLSLTMDNLEALQQPEALDETALQQLSPPCTIPATFRDAMKLAALLDVHYLWIDRLCVPQDDHAARELENSKMAYIAAGAAFVVAECDGADATHGIRGIPGGSQPRSYPQKVYPFGDKEAFVRVGGSRRKSTASRGDSTHVYPLRMRSRAETAMARRVLYFETGTVRCDCRSCPMWATPVEAVTRDGWTEADEHMWESCAHECSRERWGCPMGQSRWKDASDWIDEDWEGDGDEGPFNSPEVPWTTALAQPWPAVRRYYAMLSEVSQLKPQEPGEDMFDAVAGLVTAFSRVFHGRMIHGLPESCFDLALLWRIPAGSVRNPKRPSWTWAGWKRDPNRELPWSLLRAPEIDGADHIVAKAYPLVEVIPLTKWSVSGLPQKLSVRDPSELDSMRWHEAKEAFRDPQASLPSGWSRVEGRKLVALVKALAPRDYDVTRTVEGSHEMPAGDNTASGRAPFWYPVPVRDGDKLADEPAPARYISATLEISRGGFFVHRTDWPSHSSDPLVNNVTNGGARSKSGSQVLRDTNGRIAGVLDAHDPDHEGTFHGPGTPERTGVELVAISRCQTPLLNAPYPECETMPGYRDLRDRKWYEFYNVIWVKWRVDQDDAAGAPVNVVERRGIGRVFRNVWEASPKEMEDIVLG
ncbi:hypothetical protein GQ53DRAFT_431082 [Thozetella sp. PMI_491]|nr:hypothetical protein GQ53DRAFT_431082 [Thozetella sp. PMI_491]